MSKNNFYSVVNGYQPGIYTTWQGPNGAEGQVKGFSGALYKGFKTRQEATKWYQTYKKSDKKLSEALIAAEVAYQKNNFYGKEFHNGTVLLFTDGACTGNPGAGGYAALLVQNASGKKIIQGSYRHTTNNRMELMAVIEGLKSIEGKPTIWIISDSTYIVSGAQPESLQAKAKNNWMANGSLIKNADLWQRLFEVSKNHSINLFWVKSHSGQAENETVDEIARKNALSSPADIDYVYEQSRN